jgi:hypothetical protein
VAKLVVDLSDVPQSAYMTCVSPDGELYHQLRFEVEISVQSSLEFSLLVQGVRYGSVTAKYA